ncbi:hypothetical protein [Paenibacillus sp.]|uniref:YkvI family membrane protein n=1 Tax=Paenibacillus sp. TaxID=58172 RepID=UPI002810EB93|nr:hypothetical protein [Paenibacillus sp.]
MKRTAATMQIAFTYIGTVVGAGFATGQEILQFFTKYGSVALVTILVSTGLFIWLGTKVMLLANEIGAASYEDLNKHLFGAKWGERFSLLMLVELFSVAIVMLAGAGSVFREQLGMSFLLGIGVTLALGYVVIMGGMKGIMAVNSVVVPIMLVFTGIVFYRTTQNADFLTFEWLHQDDPYLPGRAWIAPLLYTAFNLASAQAVLVPLGAAVKDRTAIRLGGVIGGAGLGALLLIGHILLSTHAPVIFQYEIPMGLVVAGMGTVIHLMYLLLIYAEIFTTFIANIFGLSLQLEQRLRLKRRTIVVLALILCFGISFVGFKALLSTLYPFFGVLSLVWFAMIVVRQRSSA